MAAEYQAGFPEHTQSKTKQKNIALKIYTEQTSEPFPAPVVKKLFNLCFAFCKNLC